MPSGLKKSEGEGRVAQMEAEFWEQHMDICFTADTHAILHTDSAPGFGRATDYQRSGHNHIGVCEHYKVNHSEQDGCASEGVLLLVFVDGSCLEVPSQAHTPPPPPLSNHQHQQLHHHH